MKIKEHTRNQKRMYRIHKQEEKIQELELLVGKLQRENDKLITQQKEFIEYLEKTIVDSKAGSGQQYYFQEILSNYKEIIGNDINVGSKGGKDE